MLWLLLKHICKIFLLMLSSPCLFPVDNESLEKKDNTRVNTRVNVRVNT